MILPETGSIVIIDDRPEEAMPVMAALAKKGVACIYYRGYKPDELPDEPLLSVRLVILDLQLFAGLTDPHTIASNLISILGKIISAENGPYLLLIWSKKESLYAHELKQAVSSGDEHLVPAAIISLPKQDFFEQEDTTAQEDEFTDTVLEELGTAFRPNDLEIIRKSLEKNYHTGQDLVYKAKPDAIQTIETQIRTELEKAGSFHLFVIWENLVRRSASKTTRELASSVARDKDWEKNMRSIFRRLGASRLGKNVADSSDKGLLRESVMALGDSFSDKVETAVKGHAFPEYISVRGNEVSIRSADNHIYSLRDESNYTYSLHKDETVLFKPVKAESLRKQVAKRPDSPEKTILTELLDQFENIPITLNTTLHLEVDPPNEHMPGNVYYVDLKAPERREEFLETYIDKSKPMPDDYSDLAAKVRFIELEVSPICDWAQKKWKKSRLVSGIILPKALVHNIRDRNENLYKVPNVRIDGEVKTILFDAHLLKSLDINEVKARTVKFRLRRELLLDIISRLSSHVNRPGIMIVE